MCIRDRSLIPQIILIYFSPSTLLWDENVYLANAKHVLGITPYFEYFRFPLLWWLLIPLIFLFGVNLWIIKIFLITIFSLSIIFLYKILKDIEDNFLINLMFIILVVFNGLILFWTNKIYPDVLGMSFLIFSIYFFYKYLKNEKKTDLILYSLFAILSFLTKYTYGIWFISIFFLKKKDTIKALSLFLIFLLPYFIYNTILYNNPIYIFIEQFELAYKWQNREDIFKFLDNLASYIGFYLIFLIFPPKSKFEKSLYLYSILSIIYLAFFVPQKDPRYLIQILPIPIIILRNKIKEIPFSKIILFFFLYINLVYSIALGIYSIIDTYICYGPLSSVYQSIEFLRNVNATRVISNSFWVWYGNHLNIPAYSIYNDSLDLFIKEYEPDYIVYSKNYGLNVSLDLSRYKLVFSYVDICGIDVKIYKV